MALKTHCPFCSFEIIALLLEAEVQCTLRVFPQSVPSVCSLSLFPQCVLPLPTPGVPVYFVYLKSPDRFHSDVFAVVFVATLWVIGG